MTIDIQRTLTSTPAIAYELDGNCYLNITNQCTLRCQFCPKFNRQWDIEDYSLRLRQEPDVAMILAAIGDITRYKEIVFCGLGESSLRLATLLEVAERLQLQGCFVRLDTDGLANMVYGYDITPLLHKRINALSISLNAQTEAMYNEYCRPKDLRAYQAMLKFTRYARDHVSDITLTAITGLKGIDVDACADIATNMGVKFKALALKNSLPSL